MWIELDPLWQRVLSSFPEAYQAEVKAFHRWMDEQPVAKDNWTLGQVAKISNSAI